VQDWVGDWFWEALPAVGKLPMCRRSQECSRISLHRTSLVPLRLLLSANPSRYRDSCCTTIQLQQLQHTNSNYYYCTIQIKISSLTHMGWTFFVLCCLQKEHPTSVTNPRSWKDIPSPNIKTTCHMCWIRTSLVKIWIWKWSKFPFFTCQDLKTQIYNKLIFCQILS
jgi:hypothetical protein